MGRRVTTELPDGAWFARAQTFCRTGWDHTDVPPYSGTFVLGIIEVAAESLAEYDLPALMGDQAIGLLLLTQSHPTRDGPIPQLRRDAEMTSRRLGKQRWQHNDPHGSPGSGPHWSRTETAAAVDSPSLQPVNRAIERTARYLFDSQSADGYWVGELEGDSILESEFILLLAFLNQEHSENAQQAAEYIRRQQMPEGGWAAYPGGPLEISGSVKSYFALKICGDQPDAEHMQRARAAILQAGGVERVNSFTRFYLALLGAIPYSKCPAVPPELILLPEWCPFNIYEMSAWSRTIIVPLSLLWAYKPRRVLPAELQIPELFVNSPDQLPTTMLPSGDGQKPEGWFNWRRFFAGVDLAYKGLERLGMKPFRKRAIQRATEWMTERFEDSDGLGAIFPPIVWSVVALKCLGHTDDSPLVQRAMNELDKLGIRENGTLRLQPCKSPVWDTAIATLALRSVGVSPRHPAIRNAVGWLLSREVRHPGDWSLRSPDLEPSGWPFEFANEFYPDVDDTAMVLLALSQSLPTGSHSRWWPDFRPDDWSPHAVDRDVSAVLAGRIEEPVDALADIEAMRPILSAVHRGLRWVLGMQCRDGGWGAFDVDNTRELFTQVPFADHNAMIDPPTADLTARMLEMFAAVDVPMEHPAARRAAEFVWGQQESDGSWYGRWGVNYIYGTWQCLVGLTRSGVPTSDSRIQAGVTWLLSKQQADGDVRRPRTSGPGPRHRVTDRLGSPGIAGRRCPGRSSGCRTGNLLAVTDATGGWYLG